MSGSSFAQRRALIAGMQGISDSPPPMPTRDDNPNTAPRAVGAKDTPATHPGRDTETLRNKPAVMNIRWKGGQMPVAMRYVEELDLFRRHPEFLTAGSYDVKTETNLELMGMFVERLYDRNSRVSVSPENLEGLRALCREFGFSGFDNEFRPQESPVSDTEAMREIVRLKAQIHRQDVKIVELERQIKLMRNEHKESLRNCELQFSKELEKLRKSHQEEIGRLRSWEDLEVNLDDLEIGDMVDRSGYRHRKATNKLTGEVVIVGYEPGCTDEAALVKARALAGMRHPLFVPVVGHAEKKDMGPNSFYLFLKFMKNGSIEDLWKREREGKHPSWWNATVKSKVIFGIAAGMRLLQAKGVSCWGLRPWHVFLTDDFEPCIGGVDMSVELDFWYSCGPNLYVPPAPDSRNASPDIWSFAIILYFLFGGDFGPTRSPSRIGIALMRGEWPDKPNNMTDFSWDLIRRCCMVLDGDCPSFDEIVRYLHKNTEEYAFPGADIEALKEYEKRILSY